MNVETKIQEIRNKKEAVRILVPERTTGTDASFLEKGTQHAVLRFSPNWIPHDNRSATTNCFPIGVFTISESA